MAEARYEHEAGATRHAVRVLVAEDDPLFRLALSDNLADAGFGVTEAENGQDALARLADQGPFDCIILDWQMPVMDGLHVLQAMRERGDSTPALFLTTVSDQKVRDAAMAGGAIDFVDKARGFPIVLRRLEDICRSGGGEAVAEAPLPLRVPPTVEASRAAGSIALSALPRLDLRRRRIVGLHLAPERRRLGEARDGLAIADLDDAMDQVARWSRVGRRPIAMIVEPELALIARPDLAEVLSGLLTRHGLAPRDLDLALSEDMLLDLGDRAAPTLERLRRLGVATSISDFGAGFSSLARLRGLPVEGLILGPTFTRYLGDEGGGAMVDALVALGHALGLTVTADGIESEADLARLRQAGCDQVQGPATGGWQSLPLALAALPPDLG
ncbi:EAL domain-containing response regulator [Zavarzinia sp. CC-PAN008]|uniref:EAL domain-containing response regulator n=1 Tax=Zavarzinia sp. CC-PAN008 TaxID=3243332 RepID=UPI003F745461